MNEIIGMASHKSKTSHRSQFRQMMRLNSMEESCFYIAGVDGSNPSVATKKWLVAQWLDAPHF
jgi:hypothetical protein